MTGEEALKFQSLKYEKDNTKESHKPLHSAP